MILHPAILALIGASLVSSFLILYAAWGGWQILCRWDISSGSELQLNLERRTYLTSTILSYNFAFQMLSLFLFIYTADNLHNLFIGAMCAAGTLNANSYGYPLLLLKIFNFLLAGVWLVINHADNKGYDYPLLKIKYLLILCFVPLVLVESYLLIRFFSGLQADVITSCCGSLFSSEKETVSGGLAALPSGPMMLAFYVVIGATVLFGGHFYRKKQRGYLFATAGLVTFLIAAASLVSFICLYFYELPTHHCPFCLLQREYGHIGYVLYATLVGGGVAGLGVGVLMPFKKRKSMINVIPPLQQRLTAIVLICYTLFVLVVSYRIIFSSFRLVTL